jgi:ubiquinone/menaquinone biosynthesis C-methylase UbiE
MILDIGCGSKPLGFINVDLRKPTRKTQNFVLADACFLPFIKECFAISYSSHCLEHLKNPFNAIKEWHRVTKKQLVIRIPSQYWRDLTFDHYYSWNPETLTNLLSQFFPKVKVSYTHRLFAGLALKTLFINGMSKLFGFWIELEAIGEK